MSEHSYYATCVGPEEHDCEETDEMDVVYCERCGLHKDDHDPEGCNPRLSLIGGVVHK